MKTTKLELSTNSFKKKKLFVLSDLHIAEAKDNQKLMEIYEYIKNRIDTSQEPYDAFFLVGDLIDSTDALVYGEEPTETLIKFIEHLSVLAPTYIAIGNHDLCSRKKPYPKKRRWRKDERTFKQEFIKRIEKLPGTIVSQTGTFTLDYEYTVSIFNPPLDYMLNAPDGNDRYLKRNEHLYKFLKKLDRYQTNILLCHYPNALKFLHKNGYLKKVDLAIAGHNHNGMTQFLFIEKMFDKLGLPNRGIITPGKSFKKKDTEAMRGLITLDKRTKLYINPAVTSLSANTGFLKYLNPLFYSGSTEIILNAEDDKKE